MKNSLPAALASSLLIAPAFTSTVLADGHSQISASVRMGLSYEETATNNGEILLRNFGSRIKWKGEKAINDDLTAHAYYELGVDTGNVDNDTGLTSSDGGTSGVNRTREAWVGVSGGFGTVKAGVQYSAFYDLISEHTDQAWWGSCWTQFECARKSSTIKLNGTRRDAAYAVSITAGDDADDDLADEIEFGLNYKYGDYTFGLAQAIRSDEGDIEGGSMLGLMAKGDLGPVGLTLTYQDADEDFAGAGDAENLTLLATYGNVYLLVNDGENAEGSTDFTTLGYTMELSDSTLMYFEYQTTDHSGEGDDTIARTTMKFDF